eukprot:314615_1
MMEAHNANNEDSASNHSNDSVNMIQMESILNYLPNFDEFKEEIQGSQVTIAVDRNLPQASSITYQQSSSLTNMSNSSKSAPSRSLSETPPSKDIVCKTAAEVDIISCPDPIPKGDDVDTKTVCDIDTANNSIPNDNQNQQLDTPNQFSNNEYIKNKCRKLLTSPLFLSRFLTILYSLILLALSTVYCLAQLLDVELDLITECKSKTRQEIWKHSYNASWKYPYQSLAEEIQYGYTQDECWTTKKYEINTERLWYGNYYKVRWNMDGMTRSVLLGFVVVYCAVVILYSLYSMSTDIWYATKNKLHEQSQLFRVQIANSSKTESSTLSTYISKLTAYFAVDTIGWILLMFFNEILEIILQSQALLLYNGYNIFDPNNERDVYLAIKPELIVFFAASISFNCFVCGILWILYFTAPKCCYGLTFSLCIFFFDQFTDIIYSLFPLFTVVYDDYNTNRNVTVLLGQLNMDSTLTFVATFVPLFFLCNKCLLMLISSSKQLRNKYYNEWKLVQILHDTDNKKDKLHGYKIDIKSAEIYDSNGKMTASITSDKKSNHKCSKKVVALATISVLYIFYGIFLSIFVNDYINDSKTYCNAVKESKYFTNKTFMFNNMSTTELNILKQNPELFLWDNCLYKVYPFSTNSKKQFNCQCRVMVINDWRNLNSSVYDRHKYFNLTQQIILNGMFENWFMLEKFRSVYSEERDLSNTYYISNGIYSATIMRAFEIIFTKVASLETGISRWKNLEYFKLEDVKEITFLPSDFHKLKTLKYLSLIQTGLTSFSSQICNLKKLEILQFQWNTIESIPHCISELTLLKQLLVDATFTLSKIPLSIFNLPMLYDLSLFKGDISVESLLAYNMQNNVSTDVHELDLWFNNTFYWNTNNATNYWLQVNPICDNVTLTVPGQTMPKKLEHFIKNIARCTAPCSRITGHDSDFLGEFCPPILFGNGVCDSRCNVPVCEYDNGDCVQSCFASTTVQNITSCTWEQFTNDKCDPGCNNTYCAGYISGSDFGQPYEVHDDVDHGVPESGNTDMFNCWNPSIWKHVESSTNSSTNMSTCEQSNSIYSDTISTRNDAYCNPEWVGDGFCDDLCRTTTCENDRDDCQQGCSDGICALIYGIWSILKQNVGGQYTIDHVLFCEELYPKAQKELNDLLIETNCSCSQLMTNSDYNNDGYLNFREFVALILLNFDDFRMYQSENKAYHVNCSACIGMEHYNDYVTIESKDLSIYTTSTPTLSIGQCNVWVSRYRSLSATYNYRYMSQRKRPPDCC